MVAIDKFESSSELDALKGFLLEANLLKRKITAPKSSVESAPDADFVKKALTINGQALKSADIINLQAVEGAVNTYKFAYPFMF